MFVGCRTRTVLLKEHGMGKIYIDTAINTARQLWKDLLALSGSTDDSFYACDNFISMLSTASLIYSEAGCMPDAISTMKEAIGYVEKAIVRSCILIVN